MIGTGLLAGVTAILSLTAIPAQAHGERNQEPFLRMRTVQWYDVKWSTSKIKVNDEIVITGKFRLFPDWPSNLPKPDTAFLGNGTPGPVLARTESYINEMPMIQSTSLEIGRDYDFKTVLKGRIPGNHHIHPMLNVENAGPIVGPGSWVEVAGSAADFKLPIATLTGQKIENLETWGLETVYSWHALWLVIGLFWLLWWLRRPLLVPRYKALLAGKEDELVTSTDRKLGVALMGVTLLLVIGGYQWAEAKYPRTIPLQAGKAQVEPLPLPTEQVSVKVKDANYDVPGRSMRMTLKVTNQTSAPVRLGEFSTAGIRFINHKLPVAVAAVDPGFPKELVARTGLAMDDDQPLGAGETRMIRLDLTDTAWEVERLVSMLNDPDSRFGGLLFFYDEKSNRHIANVSGPIVPTFVH